MSEPTYAEQIKALELVIRLTTIGPRWEHELRATLALLQRMHDAEQARSKAAPVCANPKGRRGRGGMPRY